MQIVFHVVGCSEFTHSPTPAPVNCNGVDTSCPASISLWGNTFTLAAVRPAGTCPGNRGLEEECVAPGADLCQEGVPSLEALSRGSLGAEMAPVSE